MFEVTLVIPHQLIGLSNMPEVQSLQRPDGKKVIRFASTPKMSTYLLCFVVGDFDLVADQTKNGVMVRVFTPPGRASVSPTKHTLLPYCIITRHPTD